MKNNQKGGISKNLLFYFAIMIVAISAGYFYIVRERVQTDEALLETIAVKTSTSSQDSVLKALRDLKNIKIDKTIFDNPSFSSFYDFSVSLGKMPIKRDNPFAPINKDEAKFIIEEDQKIEQINTQINENIDLGSIDNNIRATSTATSTINTSVNTIKSTTTATTTTATSTKR